MSNVRLCRLCGHSNEIDWVFCSNCRGRLERRAGFVRRALVVPWFKRRPWDRWDRRVGRRVLFVLAATLMASGVWIVYDTVGPGGRAPLPSTDLSALPVPGDWPAVGRDPAASSYAPYDGPIPHGDLVWRFDTEAPLLTSPAVVDGRVYLATGDRRLVALDGETGELLWTLPLTGPVDSSPAVAGDNVYFGLRDHRFLAVDRNTGVKRWEYKTDNPVFSSPTVLGGIVYVGSADYHLYAFDAATGKRLWKYKAGAQINSDVAVTQDVVIVMSSDDRLHLVDARTGDGRFEYRTAFSRGSPAIEGSLVYVSDENGGLRAIDWRKRFYPLERFVRRVRLEAFLWGIASFPDQKGLVWSFRQPEDRFTGKPAIDAKNVYAATVGGLLVALDKLTGRPAWTFETDVKTGSSPSVVGDTVLYGDLEGDLHALDARSGDRLWVRRLGGGISSTPVFANDLLYVSSLDGSLYAFR